MEPRKRLILGAFHRLAYATAISVIVFLVAVQPLELSLHGATFWTIRILDLPIATAGQLLPCNERGVDLWFRAEPGYSGCPHNPGPEFFGNHMRIGIPAYLLLFYLPSLLLAARLKSRGPISNVAPLMAFLTLLLSTSPTFGAERGPSAPEARQPAVRLIRAVEDDPLNEVARAARKWVLAWFRLHQDVRDK
jgi:hypothetical protein